MEFCLRKVLGTDNDGMILVCQWIILLAIYKQVLANVNFIYLVVAIVFEIFMSNSYKNQHCPKCDVINWMHIVYCCHKMMQLFDVVWFMIMLCCAIPQTQWLILLAGTLDICSVGIICFCELKNALDCQPIQRLLYTPVPVFAKQIFLILGIIWIFLMNAIWIHVGMLQFLYFFLDVFRWIDVTIICDKSCPRVEFIHLVFVAREFVLHYHCYNCQDCQNHVIIHLIHIVCYFLIKFGHKMMQCSDVTRIMIILCCAILQTQWLTRLLAFWIFACMKKKAFDCKHMQHLLYTAFPVFAVQTFIMLCMIWILLVEGIRIWIDYRDITIIMDCVEIIFITSLYVWYYCQVIITINYFPFLKQLKFVIISLKLTNEQKKPWPQLIMLHHVLQWQRSCYRNYPYIAR